MRVQLFIPCFVDQLFPETAFNMIRILEKVGCVVSYNPEQTCCGQPAFNAGYWDECKSVGKKFLSEFDASDYIVAPSGSCTGFVRNYYNTLFKENGLPRNEVKKVVQFYEITEFLTRVLQIADVGASLAGVAAYHDACGALRECNIRSGPRKLLANVKGLTLRETDDCEVCCGFGGTFAVKFEPISLAMAEQKVHNAIKVGADYIISTDLSCLLHLDGYIRKNNLAIKTRHIVDVLVSGW